MAMKASNPKTKVKLCVITTIAAIVIVAVWGILINLILLYNLPEVSHHPIESVPRFT
jgi:uncharacterized membrane protein